jgi:hypothetical protein
MSDNNPPPVDPKADQHTIEIPIPTQNPKFWMDRVRRAFRETMTFSLLATLFILVGIGLDVGGLNFNHAGWSAEILGFKLTNAGPGDLLAVAGFVILYSSRFHVKMRRIFTGREQLKIRKVVAIKPADDSDAPPDDTALLTLVLMCQDRISNIFAWISLSMLGIGVILVGLGFDLSKASWSADGFGLKLTNTGPGVTLTIVATMIFVLTRFDVGVSGIGDARTAVSRIVRDASEKDKDNKDPGK